MSGAWFFALERCRFGGSGSRRGASGSVCCPQVPVECGVFDPIRVVLGRVDDLQRDVPDQIVLSHVLPVNRVHDDPKVRSVGVVDVVGRLWVEVVRGVDVIFRHDILQQVGKNACRVG